VATSRRATGRSSGLHNAKDDKDSTPSTPFNGLVPTPLIFEAEPAGVGALVLGQYLEQPSRRRRPDARRRRAVEQTSLSADGMFLFYATNAAT